jgi:hypothetical protein
MPGSGGRRAPNRRLARTPSSAHAHAVRSDDRRCGGARYWFLWGRCPACRTTQVLARGRPTPRRGGDRNSRCRYDVTDDVLGTAGGVLHEQRVKAPLRSTQVFGRSKTGAASAARYWLARVRPLCRCATRALDPHELDAAPLGDQYSRHRYDVTDDGLSTARGFYT